MIIKDLEGMWEGRQKLTTKEYEETIWGGGDILTVMVVIQQYLFVNIHRTGHIKMLNFTVCKLNLNLLDLRKEKRITHWRRDLPFSKKFLIFI